MKSDKIRTIVFLIGSLLVLLSGIIMYLTETVSKSYVYHKGRFEDIGMINGEGAIIIGCLLLLFTFYNYRYYKKEEKRRKEWEEKIESEEVDFDDWKEV